MHDGGGHVHAREGGAVTDASGGPAALVAKLRNDGTDRSPVHGIPECSHSLHGGDAGGVLEALA